MVTEVAETQEEFAFLNVEAKNWFGIRDGSLDPLYHLTHSTRVLETWPQEKAWNDEFLGRAAQFGLISRKVSKRDPKIF